MRKMINSKAGMGAMVLLITVCVVPAMAAAFGQGGWDKGQGVKGKGTHRSPMGIWRNSQMVENLSLTDAQVDQLRELDFQHREKQQAARAEMDSLRLEMDKAYTENNVDKTVVRRTAEKMADVRGRMFVERTEARLAVQDILTAEQVDKLQQYRMDYRGKGMRQGGKQMNGRGWGRNPDCPRWSDNFGE